MRKPIALTAALTAAIAGLGAAHAQADGNGPRCHGLAATYVGTGGDDRLAVGEADLGRDPVIVLGGGDDRLIVSGDVARGDVTACGGGGRDYLVALEDSRADAYVIDGGPGSDRMGDNSDVDNSGVGPMKLTGGAGDDDLLAADFDDSLVGGSGDDLMLALDGDDRLKGGSGDDTLFGHGGRDRADGGRGEDSCENVEVVSDCEQG